jgi:hypothetical protein
MAPEPPRLPWTMPTNTAAPRLNATQIETILDRIVPLIADPADHSFFRGVLAVKFENCSSGQADHASLPDGTHP